MCQSMLASNLRRLRLGKEKKKKEEEENIGRKDIVRICYAGNP